MDAQNIQGSITSEEGEPIPYANVYIRPLNTGTTADEQGKYFINIDPGAYELVFSSLGYQTITKRIIIENDPVVYDMMLPNSGIDLEQIVVKASKRNPAIEIIQKVIENRSKYSHPFHSYKSQIYLRAVEEIKNNKPKSTKTEEGINPMDDENPSEVESDKMENLLGNLNLVEINSTINFQAPDQYKEERLAYKKSGKNAGLYIPLAEESKFNFYKNLIHFPQVSEVPIISPISRTAIITYKFKLQETLLEGSQKIYKIKFTPRKSGNSTAAGIIFINEELWNINRIEMTLKKGRLKFYDEFTIKQSYEMIQDDLSFVLRQEFDYATKQGRYKSYNGNTIIRYLDFQPGYSFPAKFFGNEIAVTAKDAYKKDSVYWNRNRSEPLTSDLVKVIKYRDSLEAYYNSEPYKDSIEAAYNKIKFGEIIYHGVGFRNHRKKKSFYIAPLGSLLDFDPVGGFRISTYLSYSKRFENDQYVFSGGNISYGLLNNDIQGNSYSSWYYDPFHAGSVFLDFGRSYHLINSFDAYLNQLKSSNYILNDYLNLGHRREIFNGFYLRTGINYTARKSLQGIEITKALDWLLEDEEDPLQFEDYNSFISDISISYTPFQRYVTEPNRKVVLGSKYPTLSLRHKKGWAGFLKSSVNFDYLQLTLSQDMTFGIMGNSKYNLSIGKFANTKDLKYVDYKFFRQSDPWLYSDPLHSFQLLDTSLTSTGIFYELHHIHHFNGALINNIPLVKKLKVQVVVGAGALCVKESKYNYLEVFGGVERIFKLGPRRKLRLGIYGVVGNSNYQKPQTGLKFSLDLIDTWSRDWNF